MEVIAMKFEVREVTCPICGKRLTTVSQKRRFCSAECRRRYWNKHTQVRRMSNPVLKEKSLQHLFAYLEAKKKQKEGDKVG
jgi:predicted nucleic acid-binding Zn ribbon protein